METHRGTLSGSDVSEASSNAVILAVMRERLEKSLRDKEKMRQRMELLEDELALCKVRRDTLL